MSSRGEGGAREEDEAIVGLDARVEGIGWERGEAIVGTRRTIPESVGRARVEYSL